MERVIEGRVVVAGEAAGPLLVSMEPLSFWGGLDASTGEIIDRRHPLHGVKATGCVLAVPSTRGSSTTTAVLLEALRAGTAPAALVTRGIDRFLTLACIVADEMYGQTIPVVALDEIEFASLAAGGEAVIDRNGRLTVRPDEAHGTDG